MKVYHTGPTVKIAKKIKISARTLMVLEGRTKLKKYHQHKFYEMCPNPTLRKQYPHLVMYPILQKTSMSGDVEVPIYIIIWR